MIIKTCTICLTALLLSALLLIAANATAFRQSVSSERLMPVAQTSAEALFEEALLLAGTDQRETARTRLQQAMSLWAERGELEKAAPAALQMGNSCKQFQDYPEVLYYYDQALKVAGLPDALRADILNAQGLVYAELYEMTLAERAFNDALKLATRLNDQPAQTVALTGLANLYHQQGDQVKALDYAGRARRLNRQKDAGTEAALLSLIGQIRLDGGLLKEAKGAFEEALAIYEKAGDATGQSRTLSALSTVALQAAQKSVALELAERALAIANDLSARATAFQLSADNQRDRTLSHANFMDVWELQWPVYLSHARALRALGEKESARKSYLMAEGLFEGKWSSWALYRATQNCALAYKEEIQAAVREYVDLLMELGRFSDAFDVADRAKGRTLLNRITVRRRSPLLNDELAAAFKPRAQKVADLRLQMLAPNLSPERRTMLQQTIEDAEAEMLQAQMKSELKLTKAYRVKAKLADAKLMQAQIAQGQSALAEFLLGENHSYIWYFSHGRFSYATLPPRQQIEQAVREYLPLLTNPPGSLSIERDIAKVRERGTALFDMLFGPLAEQLEPGQPLIIVADGLLHYLPFSTLVHGGRYLMEDHDTVYSPSAGMLNLWQESAPRSSVGEPLELLAIGDPIFSLETAAHGSKKQITASTREARSPFANGGSPFASLPWTRDEAQYIAGLFPADRRKVLLGREGTEAAFKREMTAHYRRLHFATHSWIDAKTPWRSAVVLTPGDAEDGLLDVNEISQLNLDCDLVVVSACQTGRGQLLSGEGIVGLSRAFLYAGARDVIVSLWDVSDNSTSQLMKDFYTRLTGGQSNAEALRQAKLHMLRSNKVIRHPYYWASFIMVGKP